MATREYKHGKRPKCRYVLGVPDVESEFERLRSLGATIQQNPTNMGGAIIVAAVNDPWVKTIGLIYKPEFKRP